MRGRLGRYSRAAVAAAALLMAVPAVSRAQEESSGEEETTSNGNPYYGYIGTGVIGAMILFAVCKSARR